MHHHQCDGNVQQQLKILNYYLLLFCYMPGVSVFLMEVSFQFNVNPHFRSVSCLDYCKALVLAELDVFAKIVHNSLTI